MGYDNCVKIRKTELISVPIHDNVSKEDVIALIKAGKLNYKESYDFLDWYNEDTECILLYEGSEIGDEVEVIFNDETTMVQVEELK